MSGERAHRGRRWNESDDLQLTRLIAAREPPGRIALIMHRTQDAIRGRAGQLGLPLPSPLRPWKRFWSRAHQMKQAEASKESDWQSGDPASEGGPQ